MNRISLLILTLVFFGCEANPYPKGAVSNKPEATHNSVQPAFGVDVEGILNFKEGNTGTFPINVNVPSGNPIIEWNGSLPTGAVHDPVEHTIKWTPSFTDANDPVDFSVKNKEYIATIVLRSDADSVTAYRKTILFKVSDTPRKFNVNIDQTYATEVYEGDEAKGKVITLISEDYPQGPFNVSFKSGQPGLSLVHSISDPSTWSVFAGPYGYDALKAGSNCSDSWSCHLDIEDSVIAFAPDGRKAEVKVSFRLTDVRKTVALSLGSRIEARGDTLLSFTALDPNQEVAPVVTIINAPEVGRLEITTSPERRASAFESHFLLSWTQLPQEATGNTYKVVLNVCNSKIGSEVDNGACEEVSVDMAVLPKEIILPTVSRGDWALPEIKYLLSEKSFSHQIEIGGGIGAQVLSSKVISSDPNDTVELNSGTLSITPHTSGLKFVNVIAVNSLGGVASETFMYEVLPSSWSSNVVLGLAGTSVELSALETNLTSSNREFSAPHDARTLTGRSRVLAGTQTLALADAAKEIEFYAANLKDVFISTPKLAALPASIVDELRAHDVYLAKRGSDVPGFDLKDYALSVATTLGRPTGVTGLAGTTTVESSNPGLLSMTMSSDCTRLFSLFKPGPTPLEYLVGVSCDRPNGGKLVVLGFEWADVRISQPDVALPKQWFNRMME